MNFKFKIQQFQTDAVENTVSVFAGQPSRDSFQYKRDLGKKAATQLTFDEDYAGYRNSDIELSDDQILENIHLIQDSQDIKQSPKLVGDLGKLLKRGRSYWRIWIQIPGGSILPRTSRRWD